MAGRQFDLDPQVLRDIEEKAKRRALLKQEYFKQISNPFRHATGEGGFAFDEGVQRFMSLKATGYEYFRPTPKSGAFAFLMVIAPIGLYAWLLKWTRDTEEKKRRSGLIAYRDRKFKFI